MLTWTVITSRCRPSSLFTFSLVTVQIVNQTITALTLAQSILSLAQLLHWLMNFGLFRPISFHLSALSPEILHCCFTRLRGQLIWTLHVGIVYLIEACVTFHEPPRLISSDSKLSNAFDSSGRVCCFTIRVKLRQTFNELRPGWLTLV